MSDEPKYKIATNGSLFIVLQRCRKFLIFGPWMYRPLEHTLSETILTFVTQEQAQECIDSLVRQDEQKKVEKSWKDFQDI